MVLGGGDGRFQVFGHAAASQLHHVGSHEWHYWSSRRRIHNMAHYSRTQEPDDD